MLTYQGGPRTSATKIVINRKVADLTQMETHVALLRGINVGGRNRLPMRDLADLFISAGAHDVETYI